MMIFRKFSTLQARLILEKQDDIRLLEEELKDMDFEDFAKTPHGEPLDRFYTRHRRDEVEARARRGLMQRAERTFKEYADLLSAVQRLNSFEKPVRSEWDSARNFVYSTKPIVEREAEWVINPDLRNDVVALEGQRDPARLAAVLERLLNGFRQSRFAAKLLASPESQDRQQRLNAWLRSNSEIAKRAEKVILFTSKGVLLIITPLVFVVPIYVLSITSHDVAKSLGVLVAFTIAFTIVLLVGTPGRLFEVLSASAAYLAVLVVFFGSVSPGRQSS